MNTRRNVYMTDELEAVYDQTVTFVEKNVTPYGDAWEETGKVPRETLQQMVRSGCCRCGYLKSAAGSD